MMSPFNGFLRLAASEAWRALSATAKPHAADTPATHEGQDASDDEPFADDDEGVAQCATAIAHVRNSARDNWYQKSNHAQDESSP